MKQLPPLQQPRVELTLEGDRTEEEHAKDVPQVHRRRDKLALVHQADVDLVLTPNLLDVGGALKKDANGRTVPNTRQTKRQTVASTPRAVAHGKSGYVNRRRLRRQRKQEDLSLV